MAQARTGFLAALGAFSCWGLFGLYFKALGAVPALEILSHRVLGGMISAALLVLLAGQGGEVRAICKDPRLLLKLAGSAVAIAINWLIFVWAVNHGRALEASLGYYIYPLISIVLGRLLMGEVMSRRRWAAVTLAIFGVAILVVQGPGAPWAGLGVAVSFAAYGLARKTIAVSALSGLLMETALLTLPAILYLGIMRGGVAFDLSPNVVVLILLAGPITAIPLALFAVGARNLSMGSLGMMMYLNPTLQMVVAVWGLGETFTLTHGLTFLAIWGAVLLYSWPQGLRLWSGRSK